MWIVVEIWLYSKLIIGLMSYPTHIAIMYVNKPHFTLVQCLQNGTPMVRDLGRNDFSSQQFLIDLGHGTGLALYSFYETNQAYQGTASARIVS